MKETSARITVVGGLNTDIVATGVDELPASGERSSFTGGALSPAPRGVGSHFMTESIEKKRVIVDTDPNMWVPRRDVDDALALLFLIASPEVGIQGITVNFGNVSAPVGHAAARELVGRVGFSVPLFTGAESKHDLGNSTSTVTAGPQRPFCPHRFPRP